MEIQIKCFYQTSKPNLSRRRYKAVKGTFSSPLILLILIISPKDIFSQVCRTFLWNPYITDLLKSASVTYGFRSAWRVQHWLVFIGRKSCVFLITSSRFTSFFLFFFNLLLQVLLLQHDPQSHLSSGTCCSPYYTPAVNTVKKWQWPSGDQSSMKTMLFEKVWRGGAWSHWTTCMHKHCLAIGLVSRVYPTLFICSLELLTVTVITTRFLLFSFILQVA